MPEPILSVIVPTKDRPDLLRRALASIAAQDLPGVETIVVDDGSMMPQDWVLDLGMDLTYLRHDSSRDLAGARNTGLRHARGTYVGYLDDDDVWLPVHASRLVGALQAHPTARAAYSLAERWQQELRDGNWVTTDAKVEHDYPSIDLNLLLLTNLTPVNAVVHERSLIEETGGFDETLSVVEDWDLWIRIRALTEFTRVPEVTCAYTTRGSSNMTQQRIREFWPAQSRIYHRYRALGAQYPGLAAHQQGHLAKTLATMQPEDARVAEERARIALDQPPSDESLRIDCTIQGAAAATAATPSPAPLGSGDPEPLVSICIPTFNRVELLREALESASNQTWERLEILVSDNGSTDGTAELLAEATAADPRIRGWVNETNLGGHENYRVLLREARGEFVKFLNDDDLLHPENVERLVMPLLRDERLVLATSKRRLIDQAGRSLPDTAFSQAIAPSARRIPGDELVNLCLRTLANWIGEPTTPLFRRAAVAATTMFQFGGRTFDASADLALWFSLLSRGDAWYEPEALSSLRLHTEQDSQKPAVMVEFLTDFLAFIERAPQYGFMLDPADVRAGLTALLGRLAVTYAALHEDPSTEELLAATTRIAELLATTRPTAAEPDMPWYSTTIVVPVTDDLGGAIGNIQSISEGTPGSWFEVLFVDDAADPELGELLDSLEGDIQVVRHESRLGASASYASGIEHARGETVVLLHPHAIVRAGWLPPLVGLLAADPSIEVVLPVPIGVEAPDVRDAGEHDAVIAIAASRDLLHDAVTRNVVTTIGDSAGHALQVARGALEAHGARIVIEPGSRVDPLQGPQLVPDAPTASGEAIAAS